MNGKTRRQGVSKSEWFEAALDVLSRGNVQSITIEGLAETLGIAKSGFYWHFKSRQALMQELLQHWVNESTKVFNIGAAEASKNPKARLLHVTEKLHDDKLARYEQAFQLRAEQDEEVARAVQKVNRRRLDYFYEALSELGITGDEADVRAYLYISSVTSRPKLPDAAARIDRPELIASRIDFLTSTWSQS